MKKPKMLFPEKVTKEQLAERELARRKRMKAFKANLLAGAVPGVETKVPPVNHHNQHVTLPGSDKK